MTDYEDHCPEGGDVGAFMEATDRIVERYKTTPAPVSNKRVNQKLNRLRNTLDSLTPDVIEMLERREVSALLWDTEQEDDDARHRVSIGKSAVKLLRQLADDNINKGALPDHWNRHDKRLRQYLIQEAAILYEAHSGKLVASPDSGFVKYLVFLGKEAGFPEKFNAFKAAREYLDPNKLIKKLMPKADQT